MNMERGKEGNMQRGSVTVEAVVGFTAFLLAIFTILGVVNFCRAQMLVSAAVDTAAKEMSQYAYFYEMSGLQKFENVLDENGQVGKDNINQIIGTVDNLYGSLTGAVDQTEQEITNVENMLGKGEVDLDAFQNAVNSVENSAEGVMQGITSVGNALSRVGSDPLLYMRSVVALIGSESMEAAKRAVAVPLAKAFVSKHFGETTEEANARLEALGIEGGLDSMNFNLSNIFSDENHQNIEINVIYKVKLLQVFDWVILEANVSKVAVCRAWLGGDNVTAKASAEGSADLGGGDTEESADPEGETDPTGSGEGTEETTDPTEAPESAATGNWALMDGTSPSWEDGSMGAFVSDFTEKYGLEEYDPILSYSPSEGQTEAYLFDAYTTYNASYAPDENGNPASVYKEYMKERLLAAVEEAVKLRSREGEDKQDVNITYALYYPENMPEEQASALRMDYYQAILEINQMIGNDTSGIYEGLSLTMEYVDEGRYDYGTSGNNATGTGGAG